MNVLLTSVGRRSYLVNYFKEALGERGSVHVSNSSSMTPAFNSADYSVISPLIYEDEYIPFLLQYCKENNIEAIISLFDIDLPILSRNKGLFQENGIKVIVSDEEVIAICNDKMKTHQFLKEKKIKSPDTYFSPSEVMREIKNGKLNYPVILKPRWGMGSIGIFEAENEEELRVLYKKILNIIAKSYLKYESEKTLEESIIIQEKLNGQEYGLDVINDLNGNYQTTIVKKKYAMRSGETDAAITMNDCRLKQLGQKISEYLNHVGNLDVDVFVVNGIPYVLEMNARFGGGYPFSHASGVDLPKAIVKWLNGEEDASELLKEKIGILSHKDIGIVLIEEKAINFKEDDNFEIKKINSNSRLKAILTRFDKAFQPDLSSRIVSIEEYSKKLTKYATTFVIEINRKEVGFITFYANNLEEETAYISLLAVSTTFEGRGIGTLLMKHCVSYVSNLGMKQIKLEVRMNNQKAISFYQKENFSIIGKASSDSFYMLKQIEEEETI